METPACSPLARVPASLAAWLARAALPDALAHHPPGPGDDEDDDEPLHAARQIVPAKRR